MATKNPMKTFDMQYLIILLTACVLVGCGHNGSKGKFDTQPLETSFASAEPNIKDVVDKSVVAAKAANYRGAFDELAKLTRNEQLTPEQLQALRDAMHQLSLLFPPPVPSMAIPKP